MTPTFRQAERSAADKLIELALAEDLNTTGDLTCQALIEENENAEVAIVARQTGVLAGIPVAELVLKAVDPTVVWQGLVADGGLLECGSVVATVSGSLTSLLTGERTALNFLTHLSGIATLTRRFVDAVQGNRVKILDTRKTLPGWRVLEKYAVRAGGGSNHRIGLFDGILIKDNHLAAFAERSNGATIADAIRIARNAAPAEIPVEVEVDTLVQLDDALGGLPEIVLLDNMDCPSLRQAVERRNREAPHVLLEASGSVTLDTVAEIAATGVDRISIGALTHSALALDLAFDWQTLLE